MRTQYVFHYIGGNLVFSEKVPGRKTVLKNCFVNKNMWLTDWWNNMSSIFLQEGQQKGKMKGVDLSPKTQN